MRKMMKVLSIFIFLVFCISSVSQAGLINYERRNKKLGVSKTVEKKAVEVKKSVLSSEYKVSSRVDRIYDVDSDGILQKEEIIEFLTDVVSSVKRRGRYSVSSNLLKEFDKNKDNRISRSELEEIEKLIN